MREKYDYLIVGSGLFGATFAYRAKQAGKKCLVIEKRPHLGGNVYCEDYDGTTGLPLGTLKSSETATVIPVHKYGAHIFHTNNKEVWDFVNGLVEFNRYTNCPVANYKGELYNLPFNMNTFSQMWGVRTPEEAQKIIEEQRTEAVEEINRKHRANGQPELKASPMGGGWEGACNLEEQALTLVGKDIYSKLIKEYTEKQWGRSCKELPAFIIKRLPVRLVFDNNYFNDRYQGIPIGGYNKLINALLDGVDTITNLDFFTVNLNDLPNLQNLRDSKDKGVLSGLRLKDSWREIANNLVYCGPIDQYFDYSQGPLDWRTVTFKTRIEDTPNYQGNAVINYTSHEQSYTRVIEHKHFEMFGQEVYNCPKTVVSEEYSTEYQPGMEPFYPVNDNRNNTLLAKYKEIAHTQGIHFPEDLSSSSLLGAQSGTILFGGRLAQYKYFDMAPIIEQVLNIEF